MMMKFAKLRDMSSFSAKPVVNNSSRNRRIPFNIENPLLRFSIPKHMTDYFTDINGTLVSNHKPVGAGIPFEPKGLVDWREGGSTWEIQGNKAVNTPDVGSELLTDGDCSSDSFTKGSGWAYDGGSEEYDSDGSQGADSDLSQTISVTAGVIYTLSYELKNYSAGNIRSLIGTDTGSDKAIDGTYVDYIIVGTGGNLECGVQVDANFIGSVDNISLKALDFNTTLLPVNTHLTAGRFIGFAWCEVGGWKGVAIGLDSLTTPTKGLFAYINRTTGNFELRALTAANTWTSLIDTSFSYVDNGSIIIIYDASLKKVWCIYNRFNMGVVDVSAYGWMDTNTLQALFSTGQLNNDGLNVCDFGPLKYGGDIISGGDCVLDQFTKGTAWTHNVAQARYDVDNTGGGTVNSLTQNIGIKAGRLYCREAYLNPTAQSIYMSFGAARNIGEFVSSPQTLKEYVVGHTNPSLSITAQNNAVGWIDNVIVRRVF